MPHKEAATTPKPKKVPAPKPTAAERKAAADAKKAAELAAREARNQAFEAERPKLWAQLFSKALRVALLERDYSEVVEEHSWWFDQFSVNSRKETFTCEETGGGEESQQALHPTDVDRLNASLDRALHWFDEYDAEQERKRLEAIAKEERRQAALKKLTPEDMDALDLPKSRRY